MVQLPVHRVSPHAAMLARVVLHPGRCARLAVLQDYHESSTARAAAVVQVRGAAAGWWFT